MRITKIELAGVSDVLYHNTSITNLEEILDDNRIHMTSNLGTTADQLYKKKKFKPYFFSMSRVKFGGFAQTIDPDWISTLVIDGRRLKETYYGRSVDYWGEDWRKAADKNAQERHERSKRDRYDENEDRIYSDKPYIEPLNKYISEIHINVAKICSIPDPNNDNWEERFSFSKRYRRIAEFCRQYSIKCFFYSNFNDFKLLNKSKAISEYNSTSFGYIQKLNTLFDCKSTSELTDESKKLLERLRYGSDMHDISSSLECDIHNAKSGSKVEKLGADTLIANMRKNGIKSIPLILEYFKKKFKDFYI